MESKENYKVNVSVIVPMYNVQNLITETIESLKKNKCSLEVILIDDGSEDSTLKTVYQAVDGDERFIIIKQENQGVSSARNNGLKLAKGEYITFVDSDDLIVDGAIDLLWEAAIERKADYVYGGIKKFNKQGEWFLQRHVQLGIFNEGFKDILVNTELYYSLGPAGKLFSRKILENTQSFPKNIKYAEDQVLFFEVLLKANVIYSVGACVYLYRERDESDSELSVMQQRDGKAFEYLSDMIAVIQRITMINNASGFDEENKRKNLMVYYERAINSDLWPLLIRIMKFQPNQQAMAFNELTKIIADKDQLFVSSIPAFRYFFIRLLNDNIFYISSYEAFLAYRNFLSCIFDKFDQGVYAYFAKPNHYGTRWDDSYLIAKSNVVKAYLYFLYLSPKKRFFAYFNKNKVGFIKKYLFPFFKLFPVNKNKIIFSTNSGKPMKDNFSFILNELKKDKSFKKYKIYKFLNNSKKTSTLLLRYFHSATAKTIFLEDYYNQYYGLLFSSKTNIIQLWHACGAFKQFAHDALCLKDSNTEEFEQKAHAFYTQVIISSDHLVNHYKSAFNASDTNVLALGVARTDLFFDNKKMSVIKDNILRKYPYLSQTYNVLYAPTFRGDALERKIFHLPIDWEQVGKLSDQVRIIIKLHPVVEKIIPAIPDSVKNKVLILDSKENVNEWMIFADTLITDYSSLIFEYSLLNKPIIYFPYDLESYFDERGFYYPYETYVYGDVVYDTASLMNAINQAEIRMANYDKKKCQFKEKFMISCDGHSSQRIVKKFIDH